MCSIAGFCSFTQDVREREQALVRMNRLLSHRGPDQSGYDLSEHCALAHNRLAVVDLVGGVQPMRKGSYCLIYNGELYNTDELREELRKLGHSFRSHSDTEVLLDAYIEWGSDCLNRLNGIYAFAVYDYDTKTLFLGRDRLGVKPLFYTLTGDTLVFASELKAVLSHPQVDTRLDEEGLLQLFCLSPSRIPESGVFKGVRELPRGSMASFTAKGLEITPYWELTARPHEDSEAETVEKTRELLMDSIRRQLVSDVPLCTLLSGGLDSSIVSAVAARKYEGEGSVLSTFSFDHEGNDRYFKASLFQPNSDNDFAGRAARFLHTSHTTLCVTPEETAALLTRAVDFRDLPGMGDIDTSLLYFCGQIKRSHTVSLSGECADELFGGYPWFYREEMLNSGTFPWIHDVTRRTRLFKKGFIDEKRAREFVAGQYEASVKRSPKLSGESEDEAKKRLVSYLNIHWFMYQLLERKDRMSMAEALEVRVPFADHRLMEYVFNVPWSIKLKDGVEKSLLRRAGEGLLPDEILYRKKSPYPKTQNPRYEELVWSALEQRLEKPGSPLAAILDRGTLEEMAKSGGGTWFGQLMAGPQLFAYMIQLDYFLERFGISL